MRRSSNFDSDTIDLSVEFRVHYLIALIKQNSTGNVMDYCIVDINQHLFISLFFLYAIKSLDYHK